jgi:predicted flap endonuclease-1-like 5' DNA nuclease
MAFSQEERDALLALKGVGPTVIKRLEEIGIDSFPLLAESHVDVIADMVASMLRSSCWKNSPQAKSAISAAISRARIGLSSG